MDKELYMRKYRKKHPEYGKDRQKSTYKDRLQVKTEVLSHYGKRKKLQCRWRNCTITDVDMLSLDHIDNNGAEHRRQLTGGRKNRCGGSTYIYRTLKRLKYPAGFQTLCHNHQWKKEILRRKFQNKRT